MNLRDLEILLEAAKKIEGCSDHHCVLRVYRRGGQGTNGGCRCVADTDDPDMTIICTMRHEVNALLRLARAFPELLKEHQDLVRAVQRAEGTVHAPQELHTLATRIDAARHAGFGWLLDALEAALNTPYRCPVCDGRGKVPWDPALPTSTAHTDAGPWTCLPCKGKGVLNSKGEPA